MSQRNGRMYMVAISAGFLALAVGCKPDSGSASPSGASARQPAIDQSSALGAARGFLELSKEYLAAVARRDAVSADSLRQALAELISDSAFEAELLRSERFKSIRQELMKEVAQNWVSIVSHDVSRINLSEMQVRAAANPQSATVLAKLPDPGSEVFLKLECRNNGAKGWAIASINFESSGRLVRSVTSPATAVPATQSAPAP